MPAPTQIPSYTPIKSSDVVHATQSSNPKAIEPSIVDNLIQIDFRIWVTESQKVKLKDFLLVNGIKYGSVPKGDN